MIFNTFSLCLPYFLKWHL
uniref:Uncharacterized protein n=1 Tax=Anguilla anguilla TaxID=7936 RepID=A0A0E9U443_ANGAN